MTNLLADAEENGATLALQYRVTEGRSILNGDSNEGNIVLDMDGSEIACNNMVICAGLASDKIALSMLSTPCHTTKESYSTEEPPRIPKQYSLLSQGLFIHWPIQKVVWGFMQQSTWLVQLDLVLMSRAEQGC